MVKWAAGQREYLLERLEQPMQMIRLTDGDGVVFEWTLEEARALAEKLVEILEPPAKTDGKRQPARAGEPWRAEEEATLRSLWKENPDIGRVARALGRSRLAIQSRLAKLGLLETGERPEDAVG